MIVVTTVKFPPNVANCGEDGEDGDQNITPATSVAAAVARTGLQSKFHVLIKAVALKIKVKVEF